MSKGSGSKFISKEDYINRRNEIREELIDLNELIKSFRAEIVWNQINNQNVLAGMGQLKLNRYTSKVRSLMDEITFLKLRAEWSVNRKRDKGVKNV